MHIETPEKIYRNGVFQKLFEKLSALKLRHIFHKTIKWENFSLRKIRYVLLVPLVFSAVLVWTIAENWLKWMGFQMRRQWYGQLSAIWKRYLRWKHFCFNLLETKTDTYENVSPNTNCNGRGGVEDFWGNHVVVKEGGRGKQSSPRDRVQSGDYRKSTANEEGVIKKMKHNQNAPTQPPPPDQSLRHPGFSWALGHFLISYFEFWFHP